jgi:hypothetical protein
LNVKFGDALLPAKPLETGTDKAVDAVLGGHPKKSIAISSQRIDRKVLEPFSLAVGAEDILLRLEG